MRTPDPVVPRVVVAVGRAGMSSRARGDYLSIGDVYQTGLKVSRAPVRWNGAVGWARDYPPVCAVLRGVVPRRPVYACTGVREQAMRLRSDAGIPASHMEKRKPSAAV